MPLADFQTGRHDCIKIAFSHYKWDTRAGQAANRLATTSPLDRQVAWKGLNDLLRSNGLSEKTSLPEALSLALPRTFAGQTP